MATEVPMTDEKQVALRMALQYHESVLASAGAKPEDVVKTASTFHAFLTSS
jgi:enamine deaminase RidA (YjgF/YER057c/UK114 family)